MYHESYGILIFFHRNGYVYVCCQLIQFKNIIEKVENMMEILIVQCVERFKALHDKFSKDFEDGVKKKMIWRS
jgi:hypothetical protein